MTTRNPHSSIARRRIISIVSGLVLGLAVLAGCSSDGASTDCGLDQCTVTFDRGVSARASVLGVEAKLIGVENDQVTIEVAGERLSLTYGQQGVQVAGLFVSVDSVDDSQVAVRIAR
jgi:hypothetical protein